MKNDQEFSQEGFSDYSRNKNTRYDWETGLYFDNKNVENSWHFAK